METNMTRSYMSKAPSSVNDYDGSGDWFKIFDWGPTFNGGQSSWPMRSMHLHSSSSSSSLSSALLYAPAWRLINGGSKLTTMQTRTSTPSPSASRTASICCASSRWPSTTRVASRSSTSAARRLT